MADMHFAQEMGASKKEGAIMKNAISLFKAYTAPEKKDEDAEGKRRAALFNRLATLGYNNPAAFRAVVASLGRIGVEKEGDTISIQMARRHWTAVVKWYADNRL